MNSDYIIGNEHSRAPSLLIAACVYDVKPVLSDDTKCAAADKSGKKGIKCKSTTALHLEIQRKNTPLSFPLILFEDAYFSKQKNIS